LIIKNVDALASHGNVDGRKVVLDILDAGLKASDPYENTRRLVRVQGGKLIVGEKGFARRAVVDTPPDSMPLIFDLSKVGSIYVVGGGKAAQRMAHGIEDALGDSITEGQVNAKKGEPLLCKRIHVTFAGHPLPDEDSVAGARRIVEIMQKAKKGDIVFYVLSGGASALTTLPAPGLTLKDVQDVIRMLYFERGASMPETNAVRGMLVMLGQDRHPRYPGDATMIEFLTEEIPREIPYERIHARRASSTETSAPPYRRAVEVLKRYELWDKVPQPVRTHLERADPRYDLVTPEELRGKARYFIRVIGPEYMLEGAQKRAEELGVNANVLIKSLNDIEAQPVGELMSCIALSLETYCRPFEPPCAVLFGGETTVAVGNATGRGGRNQEFALSTALRIAGSKSIVVASVDSDGTDGPTDAAGGIVDGYTMERAREAGINVIGELKNHNSNEVLAKLGDAIYTGARSTNVRGLGIVYVGKSSQLQE